MKALTTGRMAIGVLALALGSCQAPLRTAHAATHAEFDKRDVPLL
jgi:hypothetical protein